MKRDLRKEYLVKRESVLDKDKKDKIIYEKVINNYMIKESRWILIYVSYGRKVSTLKLIDYFWKKNKIVTVPKVENGEINFYIVNSWDELKKEYKNILEPFSLNRLGDFNDFVSITSGICFNQSFYRIGYGGGYYDKFYQKYDLYKIGLCYKEIIVSEQFQEERDIPVDEIISD